MATTLAPEELQETETETKKHEYISYLQIEPTNCRQF